MGAAYVEYKFETKAPIVWGLDCDSRKFRNQRHAEIRVQVEDHVGYSLQVESRCMTESHAICFGVAGAAVRPCRRPAGTDMEHQGGRRHAMGEVSPNSKPSALSPKPSALKNKRRPLHPNSRIPKTLESLGPRPKTLKTSAGFISR